MIWTHIFGVQYWIIMKKTKKQPPFVLRTLFTQFYMRNLLILTATPHNLLMNCIFWAYLSVNGKWTKKQPTEVFINTLFGELYKITSFVVYFSNQKTLTCFIRLTRRRKIAQIIIDMPNYFFLNAFTLF